MPVMEGKTDHFHSHSKFQFPTISGRQGPLETWAHPPLPILGSLQSHLKTIVRNWAGEVQQLPRTAVWFPALLLGHSQSQGTPGSGESSPFFWPPLVPGMLVYLHTSSHMHKKDFKNIMVVIIIWLNSTTFWRRLFKLKVGGNHSAVFTHLTPYGLRYACVQGPGLIAGENPVEIHFQSTPLASFFLCSENPNCGPDLSHFQSTRGWIAQSTSTVYLSLSLLPPPPLITLKNRSSRQGVQKANTKPWNECVSWECKPFLLSLACRPSREKDVFTIRAETWPAAPPFTFLCCKMNATCWGSSLRRKRRCWWLLSEVKLQTAISGAQKAVSHIQEEATCLQNALKAKQAEWASCTNEQVAGTRTGSSRFPTISGRKEPLETWAHPPLPCSLLSRSA